MKKLSLFISALWLLGMPAALAQTQVGGKVEDLKGNPVELVSINIKDADGNIITYTRSNEKGEYKLSIESLKIPGLTLEASCIGYKKTVVTIKDSITTYNLVLNAEDIMLNTVVVKDRPALSANGDSLNYKTSDFADNQDRSISDVLKKMPGIEVTENGKVSYNGQDISNLYIDGDNILDDRYNIGTRSIPHGAVDQVQVIQNDQPLKMMRENNMSEDVAINLVIKDEAKLKVMGEAALGAGTPERFDGNLSAMLFNKDLKFINNLKGNNIGIDPGLDLTAHNRTGYLNRLDNNKPQSSLSTGAADVPSLPESRSLFNKAGLINLNNLYKFNQDLQLKANVSYLYDQRNQNYSKFSETYLPNETISYSELQSNTLNPQQLRTQLNLNDNAALHYLNNTFILEYTPFKTSSSIVLNNSAANQLLAQHTLDISNEFNYRKKQKSGDIINFYSYLDRTSQPETLTILPGINEDILNNGMPYAGISQYLQKPSWYFNNYISFAAVSDKLTQTYKGGFNLQQQNLESELYLVQNDQSADLAAGAVNDLDWFKTKFYAEAMYEFNNERLKATLNLPLSYNMISYKDAANALDKNQTRLFLEPALEIKYQTGTENYITANYSFNNKLGGMDDIYGGTILRNYRSLFSNDAPLSETAVHTIGAGFNYRKAMQMLFANFSVNYSDAALNTLSSFTLTNSIQQRLALALPNHVRSLLLNANISKYLFDLKSTVNAGITFNQRNYEQFQNNRLFAIDARTTTYKAGIEAKISRLANWSYGMSYLVSNNKSSAGNAGAKHFEQLRQRSALSVSTIKNLYVNLSAEHLFTRQSAQNDLEYLFADVSLRYKLLKLKTDLEFKLTNIANIKSFDAVNLSGNTLTSGTYYIPGRVAMLKATFNF